MGLKSSGSGVDTASLAWISFIIFVLLLAGLPPKKFLFLSGFRDSF
jgi:hypothetical protein